MANFFFPFLPKNIDTTSFDYWNNDEVFPYLLRSPQLSQSPSPTIQNNMQNGAIIKLIGEIITKAGGIIRIGGT